MMCGPLLSITHSARCAKAASVISAREGTLIVVVTLSIICVLLFHPGDDLLQRAQIQSPPPALGAVIDFDSLVIGNFHVDVANRAYHCPAAEGLLWAPRVPPTETPLAILSGDVAFVAPF